MNPTAWLLFAGFCVFAYLLGSVPFGFIIGKFRGVDIREHGSRNIGATNCGRVCGKPWGVLAFVLDVAKGYLPVLSVLCFGMGLEYTELSVERFYLLVIIVALCAILGHVFPVWLKFKGGKAVATSLGVLLAIPQLRLIALGALGVWVIALLVSRYVSVASTAAAVGFGAAYFIWYREQIVEPLLFLSIFVALILVLVIVRHIPNYKRLARGTENRVSFG
ncbi:MAG: glycerol-3-phosphate 1-O-acyltransferase PlsY, partial [Planctomycetia bacterium]|nr:glycerol-3-phosphate 1-O-acyltransferase PlsY [Planctomycetia bacterium]